MWLREAEDYCVVKRSREIPCDRSRRIPCDLETEGRDLQMNTVLYNVELFCRSKRFAEETHKQ